MGSERIDSKAPGHARRVLDALGLLCLVVTLLLLSTGVRIAHADEPEAPLMSVDPALVAERVTIESEAARPKGPPGPAAVELPPGAPGVEVAPGVIRLNTSGYNYRPVAGRIAGPPQPSPPAATPASALPDPSR